MHTNPPTQSPRSSPLLYLVLARQRALPLPRVPQAQHRTPPSPEPAETTLPSPLTPAEAPASLCVLTGPGASPRSPARRGTSPPPGKHGARPTLLSRRPPRGLPPSSPDESRAHVFSDRCSTCLLRADGESRQQAHSRVKRSLGVATCVPRDGWAHAEPTPTPPCPALRRWSCL